MSAELIVHSAGPAVTVQDMGRPGWLAEGLGRGGAMDRLALSEGAALLGQPETCAALEMGGMGGVFEVTADVEIALTGARMAARIDGRPIAWNASHLLPAGARLEIGAVQEGAWGYLHLAGGIATEPLLGSRAAHLVAGIGRAIRAGDRLPLGTPAAKGRAGLFLEPEPRFSGGVVRVLPGLQADFFAESERARFAATRFTRDMRANRMGVRLTPEGEGFMGAAGLTIVSEVIMPGDVQVTGDGAPYVLVTECQTTGGYPRIATVIEPDLPRVAQAPAGAELRFTFVSLEEAVDAEARARQDRAGLKARVRPLVRDPAEIPDLLAYQLIGGVISATDPPQE
jgi:allophanate hydrolase